MTWHPKKFRNPLSTCCIGLFVVGVTLFAVPAGAQTAVEAAKVAAEIDRVASNLPPESRTVIKRLTLLGELPTFGELIGWGKRVLPIGRITPVERTA